MVKIKTCKKHKTQKIALKTAKVDERMIPVINWLNNMEGIYTRWCCEGDMIHEPYIIFYADNLRELGHITRCIDGYGVIELSSYGHANVDILRYRLRFYDKTYLRRFKTTISQ